MQRISTTAIQPFETAHIEAVRKAAPECMVLLKYDGQFPIEPCKIAVFGSGVRHTVKGGTGSGDVNVRAFRTVEQGLTDAGFTLTSGAWLDAYDGVRTKAKGEFAEYLRKVAEESDAALAAFGITMPEPEYDIPLDGEGEAALYVLARNSGEGADRKVVAGDINLTETEIRDILSLSAKYAHFMLVLNVGGMVDLTPVKNVQNILLMSQLGTPSGDALADVLCGKAAPSGHLTMTWAPIDNYPSTEGFGHETDTYYREGIFVGYRYFDTFHVAHTYPFGYGLTYTTFDCRTLSFTANEETITVEVEVKNTGNCEGKQVVQLYYSAPDGKLCRPLKELAAYAKTKALAPGEVQTLSLSFPTTAMNAYDEERAAYILEPGVYEVLMGVNSDDVTPCGKVSLACEVITRQLAHIGGKPDFTDMKPATPKPAVSPEGAVMLDASKIATCTVTYAGEPEEIRGKSGTWEDVKQGRLTLKEFVGGLTNEQLAYLCIGNYRDMSEGESLFEVIGNASSLMAGAAGETTGRLKSLGVPVLTMPDGPAGLRLSPEYVLRNGSAVALRSSLEPNDLKDTAPNETHYYQYCIAIPIGTAIAQSFDADLARTLGDLVGEEMVLFGANLWLAPALNIYRNPLCGRNFEYYSEDPVVAGLTAAGITEGVQSHSGCATTIKHFCCNNQETNRMHSNSVLSERALREIYMKGFELCIRKAQPHCVMSSYNLINGEHANSRRCIQTMALRDEWSFKGFVMTDWLTTIRICGEQKYDIAYTAGCIKAGNDMVMPGVPSDFDNLMQALCDENDAHHLTRAYLQEDALHVLTVIDALT